MLVLLTNTLNRMGTLGSTRWNSDLFRHKINYYSYVKVASFVVVWIRDTTIVSLCIFACWIWIQIIFDSIRPGLRSFQVEIGKILFMNRKSVTDWIRIQDLFDPIKSGFFLPFLVSVPSAQSHFSLLGFFVLPPVR